MKFDVLKFARKHGYRTRNLHDGYPVPPILTNKQKRRSKGYARPDESRHDTIMCVHGYIDRYSENRAGWFIFGCTLTTKLKNIQTMGGIITQIGDKEAAGHISPDKLKGILKLLKPRKKRVRKPL